MGPLIRNDNNAPILSVLLLSCSCLHKLETASRGPWPRIGALTGAGWGVEFHGVSTVKGQEMKHIVFAWNFVQTLVMEIKAFFPSIAGTLLL